MIILCRTGRLFGFIFLSHFQIRTEVTQKTPNKSVFSETPSGERGLGWECEFLTREVGASI